MTLADYPTADGYDPIACQRVPSIIVYQAPDDVEVGINRTQTIDASVYATDDSSYTITCGEAKALHPRLSTVTRTPGTCTFTITPAGTQGAARFTIPYISSGGHNLDAVVPIDVGPASEIVFEAPPDLKIGKNRTKTVDVSRYVTDGPYSFTCGDAKDLDTTELDSVTHSGDSCEFTITPKNVEGEAVFTVPYISSGGHTSDEIVPITVGPDSEISFTPPDTPVRVGTRLELAFDAGRYAEDNAGLYDITCDGDPMTVSANLGTVTRLADGNGCWFLVEPPSSSTAVGAGSFMVNYISEGGHTFTGTIPVAVYLGSRIDFTPPTGLTIKAGETLEVNAALYVTDTDTITITCGTPSSLSPIIQSITRADEVNAPCVYTVTTRALTSDAVCLRYDPNDADTCLDSQEAISLLGEASFVVPYTSSAPGPDFVPDTHNGAIPFTVTRASSIKFEAPTGLSVAAGHILVVDAGAYASDGDNTLTCTDSVGLHSRLTSVTRPNPANSCSYAVAAGSVAGTASFTVTYNSSGGDSFNATINLAITAAPPVTGSAVAPIDSAGCADGTLVDLSANPRSPGADNDLAEDCQALVALHNHWAAIDENRLGTISSTTFAQWGSQGQIQNWSGITIASQRVTQLNLSNSMMRGTLPPEIGDLTALTQLHMNSNRLTGQLPPELGDLTGLTQLNLEGGNFSGAIPDDLSSLTSLVSLQLGGGSLSGPIPSWLGTFSSLATLNIHDNDFTGPLPASLSSSSAVIRLCGNRLTGSVPTALQDNMHSSYPTADGYDPIACQQTPPLEPEYDEEADYPLIEKLEAAKCSTGGYIPLGSLVGLLNDCLALVAAQNFWAETEANRNLGPDHPLRAWASSGHINNWAGVTVHNHRVIGLDISGQGIFGELPREIGSLTALRTLDISENYFTGSLPPVWANLAQTLDSRFTAQTATGSLTYFDFCLNHLTGDIPAPIANYGANSLLLGNLAERHRPYLNAGVILYGTVPDALAIICQRPGHPPAPPVRTFGHSYAEVLTGGAVVSKLVTGLGLDQHVLVRNSDNLIADGEGNLIAADGTRYVPLSDITPAAPIYVWNEADSKWKQTTVYHCIARSDPTDPSSDCTRWRGTTLAAGSIIYYIDGYSDAATLRELNLRQAWEPGRTSDIAFSPPATFPVKAGKSIVIDASLYASDGPASITCGDPSGVDAKITVTRSVCTFVVTAGTSTGEASFTTLLTSSGTDTHSGTFTITVIAASSITYTTPVGFSVPANGMITVDLSDYLTDSDYGFTCSALSITSAQLSAVAQSGTSCEFTATAAATTGTGTFTTLVTSSGGDTHMAAVSIRVGSPASLAVAGCTDGTFIDLATVVRVFGPNNDLVEDCEVLVAVQNAWAADAAHASLGAGHPLRAWGIGSQRFLPDWEGITVSGGRITGLSMDPPTGAGGLTGTIPSQISSLTALASLDLSNNALSGAIPVFITATVIPRQGSTPERTVYTPALTSLDLSNNSFSGPIPFQLIVSLESIVTLDLSHNQLNGNIEGAFGNLADLISLDLSHNAFSGSIPAGLGALQTPVIDPMTGDFFPVSRVTLDLSDNQLTGEIPERLGRINRLTLGICNNLLTGVVPTLLVRAGVTLTGYDAAAGYNNVDCQTSQIRFSPPSSLEVLVGGTASIDARSYAHDGAYNLSCGAATGVSATSQSSSPTHRATLAPSPSPQAAASARAASPCPTPPQAPTPMTAR